MKKPSARRKIVTGKPVTNPELVFGLVGPIGVDMELIADMLKNHLREVSYDSEVIHLTKHMRTGRIKTAIEESSYYAKYKSLIKYANEYRRLARSHAAMAGLSVLRVREIRETRSGEADHPSLGFAYIVRQFKRPEEIALMRRIYGRKFIQVSVYGSALDRRKVLMEKISRFDASSKTDAVLEKQAIELIDIDFNESEEIEGQRLVDVFHLGDVFVDGIDKEKANKTLRRFIRAFFGDNSASPTKDEYGLYTASTAALRSVDLSRQVGAAIFSEQGDIVSMGCNEVPRSGGGAYWSDGDCAPSRDVERGSDANQDRKAELIFDLVSRLDRAKLLARTVSRLKSTQKKVNAIFDKSSVDESQMMDIIEFGRMIHAEMSAITDAARLGRATKDTILFCTTFPCHLCAKHIVAAGINRVVFLEPYPKSHAQKLHADSITFETVEQSKVLFVPFIGISPRRYRDLFEKKKRKDAKGRVLEWYEGAPVPMVEDKSAAYIENEAAEIFLALQHLH